MKLIKIQDYFIVVSDKIEEGISRKVKYYDAKVINNIYKSTEFNTKKITFLYVKGIEKDDRTLHQILYSQNPEHNLPSIIFSDEVAKELGIVDIEKLVLKHLDFVDVPDKQYEREDYYQYKHCLDMYNQCLSDNKDKQFTLKDMEAATSFGIALERFRHTKTEDISDTDEFKEFLQSLNKTEWSVEVEMEKKCWCMKPMSGGCFECTEQPKITNNSIHVIKIVS